MYSMTGMSSAQLPATTKNAKDMQCSATCAVTLRDKRCSLLAALALHASHTFLKRKKSSLTAASTSKGGRNT